MKKHVLVTGGFDPLHSGHIAYFEAAKKLGDTLVVGVNSDEWLCRKKGRAFMPWTERVAIIKALKCVDYVLLPFDDDDGSSIGAIKMLHMLAHQDSIIFANGGDRTKENIPEMSLDIPRLEFAFGVGGEDKKNSSSWILNEWKAPTTQRVWGEYRVLHEVEGCKVKELTVMPGRTLSMQKHSKRKEYWVVTEGKCKVEKEYSSLWLHKHETMFINTEAWHQLSNPFDVPCRIVEIQYGEECIEEDIERK